MTLLYFLESLSWRPRKAGWLKWHKGLSRRLRCPACHESARMSTKRSVASPYARFRRFRLYDCPACGSAHFPDIGPPPYEDRDHGHKGQGADAPHKFYTEQGAGLETMVAPYFWASGKTVRSVLEVGCGYGFSLDFAARGLGLRVQGIDPSHIARTGAKELGVPILHTYLDATTPLPGKPFDLVYSSEVIEHIADPDDFLSALADAADAGSAVMLTTPDIAGLTSGRPEQDIIPLLSPGSHLVLFSAKGLGAALQRAGFAEVTVHTLGDTLYAIASQNKIRIDLQTPVNQPLLIRYFQNRLKDTTLPGHLITGFAGRLLRRQVDAAVYKAAQKTFGTLRQHWKKIYQIDIGKPEGILPVKDSRLEFFGYAKMRPFNLVGVLYCAAVLALNDSGNIGQAKAFLSACIRAHKELEPILSAVNVSDLESRHLARQATLLLAGLQAADAPEAALDGLERAGVLAQTDDAPETRNTILQVFAGAANSGDYVTALRLRERVETLLSKTKTCTNEFERAAALGLAILALNHDFDRSCALHWFEMALVNAPESKTHTDMRHIWAKHALVLGVQTLVQNGQKTFAQNRQHFAQALRDQPLRPEAFAVIEALGLAYFDDQPREALDWLQTAHTLANSTQKPANAARISALQVRLFIDAVNDGNPEHAAQLIEAASDIAEQQNNPSLWLALGFDALNRRGNLEAAQLWFARVAGQVHAPDMAIHGAFHLALVLARQGKPTEAGEVAQNLYSPANANAALVQQLVGQRATELDAAIASAA